MIGQLLLMAYVVVIPTASIAGGLCLVRATRGNRQLHPICRACGVSLFDCIGKTGKCPGCQRHFALGGIRPRNEPDRAIAPMVGAVTIVLGVLSVLAVVGRLIAIVFFHYD